MVSGFLYNLGSTSSYECFLLLFLMNMAIDIDDDKDEENEENGVPGCETHIESIL